MKTISMFLLLIVATTTIQAQVTVIKNKRIMNDSSYTSTVQELNGAFKMVSAFVSCNDTINAVVFTYYRPSAVAQWASVSDTIALNTTGGGQGIALRGYAQDRIPAAKQLYFVLEFQSSGNSNDEDTTKVANVIYTSE